MRKLLWLFLALPLAAFSQVSNPSVQYVSVAPSGACSASPPVQVVISTGVMYTCNNGTWAAVSGGGGYAGCTADGSNGIKCTGAFTSGDGGATSGSVDLSGSSTGSAHLSVAASAGTPATVLMPTTDPTEGQALLVHAPSACTGYSTVNCVQLYWGSGGSSTLIDSFGGTVSTLLSAHTSDSGNTWTQTAATECTGTLSLTGSSSIVSSPANQCGAYYSNWTPSSANYTVQASCTVSGTSECALVARGVAGAAHIDGYDVFFKSGTGVGLYSASAGSFTQIGSTYSGVTGGTHTIALKVSGTTISVDVDGTTQITGTDSTYTTAGVVAVYVYDVIAANATMSSLTAF